MKSLISIAEICPLGYYSVDQDLDGTGKEWAKPSLDSSRSLQHCADICNHRSGCTSFEYANGPHQQGGCGTYTGGDGNIQNQNNENRTQPGSNWFSCVRIGEGLYFI